MIQPIPVLCDRCRAEGAAGDSAFSAIPDILDFEPVPRRAHVNNWTGEHQRAFIAALALTGSPARAARALGRHMFGAQQLRSARGGRSFSEAWDAALGIARDREFARIHANVAQLAADAEAADAAPPPGAGKHVAAIYGPGYDPDEFLEGHSDYVEGMGGIRDRLLGARRLFLRLIHGDPLRRAAWEVLVGPADWDKAGAGGPQPDEPPYQECGVPTLPNMRGPDMLLTAEVGLLPELTGGPDLVAMAEQVRSSGEPLEDLPPSPEAQAAEAAFRAELKAAGWVEDEDGGFIAPDADAENDNEAPDPR